MGWIRRRPDLSWHALRTWTRVPGRAITRCGRTINEVEHRSDLPGNEKSCESCLRYLASDSR